MSAPPPPIKTDRIPFLTRLIATGLYTGYSPVASGTAGSIAGILLYCIPGFSSPRILVPAVVIAFFAGVYTSARVAAAVGNRINPDAKLTKDLFQGGGHGEADPSIVVIDEIVGMWIALILVPSGWIPVLLAFIFFRAFDILKPFPAAALERIPGGWGIMLDDVIAGIYANAAVQILAAIAGTFR